MADRATLPTVWRMVLGQKGIYETVALEQGVVFVGYGIGEDLSGKSERYIKELVSEKFPGMREGQKRSNASKLAMLCRRMKVGDLVVVVLKKQIGRLAIGRITGGYQYDAKREGVPHTRTIKWVLPEVPISPDWDHLINFIQSRSTINQIRNKETVGQVHRLVATIGKGDQLSYPLLPEREEQVESELLVHEVAHLQIATLIHERFPDKLMERLVAYVLEAEGYTIGPLVGGADQGVDVIAGHGLLGFEEPLMCVQVKHEQSRTSSVAVQQLRGAVEQFGAQQGLFVSWGGYTSAAESEARRDFFRMRLWDANDLIEAVCRNYGKLPAELRAEIPLQQVWAVAPDDSSE